MAGSDGFRITGDPNEQIQLTSRIVRVSELEKTRGPLAQRGTRGDLVPTLAAFSTYRDLGLGQGAGNDGQVEAVGVDLLIRADDNPGAELLHALRGWRNNRSI